MKNRHSFLLRISAFFCVMSLLSPHVLFAFEVLQSGNNTTEDTYVSGEILVKYKEGQLDLQTPEGQAIALEITEENSLTLEEHLTEENISVVATSEEQTTAEAIILLENDPSVEYAEPNYIRHASVITTDDTHRALLWGIDNTGQTVNSTAGTLDADIDAPEAWGIDEGASHEVIVAVIDNGILYTHPDLTANMWDGTNCKSDAGVFLGGCNHGYDYQDNDLTPLPSGSDSHGTHVAGIVGAAKNNTAGVIGVAPHVKLMALRAGTGLTLTLSNEIKAINFARENGAKIINASFGGAGFSQAEYDAISAFTSSGGIFVAASGNSTSSNDATPIYPANYDLSNIIAVAATDQNDALATFSNYGGATVDVGAPGVNILSTVTGDAYAYASGTSMAAPYVSGLTALLFAYKNTLTPLQIKDIIVFNGDALPALASTTISGKRINAYRALSGADLTTLSAAIVSAQTLHDGAIEGADIGNYIVGSKAVLQSAIDTATALVSSDFQSEADAVLATLSAAVQTFLDSTVTTAPSRRSGGGGGGGGRSKKTAVVTPVAEVAPTSPPSDCQPGYAFSPLTGLSCGSASTPVPSSDPVRYLFNLPATPKCILTTTLRQGSRGQEVTCLQSKLGLTADGSFGPKTKAIVTLYQQTHPPLTADGVVGLNTRASLNGN